MLKSRFYILIIFTNETPFIRTYTNDQGQRRIRIFNQRYQTTETYPRFFKGIDGTAIASHWLVQLLSNQIRFH